jgi:hypothetical protein
MQRTGFGEPLTLNPAARSHRFRPLNPTRHSRTQRPHGPIMATRMVRENGPRAMTSHGLDMASSLSHFAKRAADNSPHAPFEHPVAARSLPRARQHLSRSCSPEDRHLRCAMFMRVLHPNPWPNLILTRVLELGAAPHGLPDRPSPPQSHFRPPFSTLRVLPRQPRKRRAAASALFPTHGGSLLSLLPPPRAPTGCRSRTS